eukprot:5834892-Pyramimonas_sp.AAC.1
MIAMVVTTAESVAVAPRRVRNRHQPRCFGNGRDRHPPWSQIDPQPPPANRGGGAQFCPSASWPDEGPFFSPAHAAASRPRARHKCETETALRYHPLISDKLLDQNAKNVVGCTG